jgi:3-oxoacyl-[acyl-carrier protein] reductase
MKKVALVTGAARGIGEATALRLAADGYDLAVADLELASLKEVVALIEKQGKKALPLAGNVSVASDVKAWAERCKSEFGRIDVLVNNAGITRDGLLSKLTEEAWDQVLDVNLKGPFLLTQAFASLMVEQKQGVIINISSIAALGNVGQTNYSASKAGVLGLTKSWALELARFGIRVNAVAPGFVDSVMTQKVPPEIKEKFISKIPLKRMAKPDEIAAVVAFLASPAASYLTGQCLFVDGGLSVGIGVG